MELSLSRSQQGPALTGEGGSFDRGFGEFGESVTLSESGRVALVGGPGDGRVAPDPGVGAVWTFGYAQPGCTDSWTDTAGGSWFDGADWSNGAPPGPEEEACITAPGTYAVDMDQTSSTGTVGVRALTIGATSGRQTLVVAGTCTQNAKLASDYGIANRWSGAIVLSDGEACASDVTLEGYLANAGSLEVEAAAGGARTLEGDLANRGLVSLSAGSRLHVAGGYDQATTGRLKTFIAGATHYGSLAVERIVSLAGTLVTKQVAPFKASLGETFALLTQNELNDSYVIGAFSYEPSAQIDDTGLFFEPVYSENEVSLRVAKATARLSAYSGRAGIAVTVSGSEYPNGDTITPTFTDSKGVTTSYPSVTVEPGGKFSTTVEIPSGAALGIGKVKVQSAQNRVKVSRNFTVTP
jgi:hypothetical protein